MPRDSRPSQNAAAIVWHSFLARFSLLDDKADDSSIDESLRAGFVVIAVICCIAALAGAPAE